MDSVYLQPNPQKKKKNLPLSVRLLVGYPLKKYSRIFLKLAGTREYPHTCEYLNIYIYIYIYINIYIYIYIYIINFLNKIIKINLT